MLHEYISHYNSFLFFGLPQAVNGPSLVHATVFSSGVPAMHFAREKGSGNWNYCASGML